MQNPSKSFVPLLHPNKCSSVLGPKGFAPEQGHLPQETELEQGPFWSIKPTLESVTKHRNMLRFFVFFSHVRLSVVG
jgi:hypothetical protein